MVGSCFAGCSADSKDPEDRRGGVTPTGGAAGTSGTLAGRPGSRMEGGIDNPSVVPTPTTPVATAGSARKPPPQRTPNTQIDREPTLSRSESTLY